MSPTRGWLPSLSIRRSRRALQDAAKCLLIVSLACGGKMLVSWNSGNARRDAVLRDSVPVCLAEDGVATRRAANLELARLARELHAKTQAAARGGLWPDERARSALHRGLEPPSAAAAPPRPKRFARDGPLEVVAFVDAMLPNGLDIFRAARRDVFEPFVRELEAALAQGGTDADARAHAEVAAGVHWPEEHTAHTIALVFSEHPSLLDDAARATWRRIESAEIDTLAQTLELHARGATRAAAGATALSERACRVSAAIELRVHGYAVTPDGSMLLLLEEALHEPARGSSRGAGGGFGALRSRLQAHGEATLGTLNSRPKKLIHVTCGRLLAWPGDARPDGSRGAALGADAAARVGRVAQRWSEHLARGTLPPPPGGADDDAAARGGLRVPNLGARLAVNELELVRDLEWMMGSCAIASAPACMCDSGILLLVRR